MIEDTTGSFDKVLLNIGKCLRSKGSGKNCVVTGFKVDLKESKKFIGSIKTIEEELKKRAKDMLSALNEVLTEKYWKASFYKVDKETKKSRKFDQDGRRDPPILTGFKIRYHMSAYRPSEEDESS